MSLSPPSSGHLFPPADFLDSSAKTGFVSHWDKMQPPPNSALVALAHRIGIASIFPSEDEIPLMIRQACTHPSFARDHRVLYPEESVPPTNGMLSSLGNSLMGLFAAEHLNASYPHLPTRVLKAAVGAYVGHQTCTNVAQEIGVAPLLRWHRKPSSTLKPAVVYADALASVPRAITALIYHYRSLAVARKFVHTFFLSRLVDLRTLIKFRDPKLALTFTVEQFKRERPISKLLRESGRASSSPVYVVGIFSGADKLGEGFGSSLKMAEYRAAEDALHRLYLTRTPDHLLSLPTQSFPVPEPGKTASVYDNIGPSLDFTPGELGRSEILYGMNDEKELNVEEDRKRPWWRPAERDPVTKPIPDWAKPRMAKREAKKERALAAGRPELLAKRKMRMKKRYQKYSLGQSRRRY